MLTADGPGVRIRHSGYLQSDYISQLSRLDQLQTHRTPVNIENIPFSIDDVVDFRKSGKEILEQYAKSDTRGLLTHFHGHPVLLQHIQPTSINGKSPGTGTNRVNFQVDDSDHLLIPSHGLKITRYMIWVTYDYFADLSITAFTQLFPDATELEFKGRELLSWKETCAFEGRIYSRTARSIIDPASTKPAEPGTSPPVTTLSEYFSPYTLNIYNESCEFFPKLAHCLSREDSLFAKLGIRTSRKPRVLDLASSGEPWFALGLTEHGIHDVHAFDFQEPDRPGFLGARGVHYVRDDINNLRAHAAVLGDLDLIFCRNFSPPQKLINWYDRDYVDLWKTMLEMLASHGMIYWIQMSNGTGRPDSFFAQHSMSYFAKFFADIDARCVVTKYGYFRFLVSRRPIEKKWRDLLLSPPGSVTGYPNDPIQRVKNFALQLQAAYAEFGDNLDRKVDIFGPLAGASTAKALLEDNFRFSNVSIAGIYEGARGDTLVVFPIGDKIRVITLRNLDLMPSDHFLVDGQEDRRFDAEFLSLAERSMKIHQPAG